MKVDEALIDRIAAKVLERVACPMIVLEASGRHVHLTREAVETLFGRGYQLTRKSDLSQPGQFACEERVTVQGPKKSIPNVIVLGPERPETQVELSATDALALGISAPVHMSGDIANTPGAKIIGPKGEIELANGVIVAKRHIHMTPEDAHRYGVANGQSVSVRLAGERGVTFHDVIIRVSPKFATFMHIDYDEANACGFQKGMAGIILTE